MFKRNFSIEKGAHMKALFSKYATLDARIKSMRGWPCGLTQDSKSMAKAGFFYEQYSDWVTCHFCGLILREWLPNDCPWEQHIQWNENCKFILLFKGENFIKDVKLKIALKTKDQASIFNVELKNKSNSSIDVHENFIKNICSICYAEEANVVVWPCRHVFCVSCVAVIEFCPLCRSFVSDSFKLFYN